ncbi:putative nucleic-acid-binding protein containing a Zn-ribbon [Frankia torreyi]|uniref:Putative nucleic-acid-binding protein containing a Zn-ribbon n=1 Tax=Frankia torreyi TaxID=1856 RepID=A0A0D8BC50_9ACTN|nr:OB-fold domain-containing protein [Frankia sp. ArI3]KJE21736.1 putative nucleic-acid-binding protein containing a Zn-ribbon [Frankia torreyi]KQC36544.1 hypothetical protein UK82_20190 [Frankia sp. ACN1ag]KQM03283.1 putative nucleic-acid-binding protein containing a Zn-ribbon [Frankia sp. CpI1-P]
MTTTPAEVDVDPLEDPAAFFWRECGHGVFWLQHCDGCAKWQYYPRHLCSHCWSRKLTWRRPSGLAVVETFSVVHRGSGAFADLTPYTVALVRLAEGPTMMTNIVDVDPDKVEIGLEVQLDFARRGDRVLPVFRKV